MDEFGILEKLNISALNEMQLAVKECFNSADDLLILSPTGSGKTLAFILPVLKSVDINLNQVQVLIVVPSRELALQIEQVIRNMGTGLKVNAFYGGRAGAKDKIELKHEPQILIGTPGRLASHIKNNNFDSETIHTLILDEFDKSLEIGFDNEMIEILDGLSGIKKQIFTSATYGVAIPDFIEIKQLVEVNFLNENFTNKLKLELIHLPGKTAFETVLKLINSNSGKPGIIFCNYRETVENIGEQLRQVGIEFGLFHGDMEQLDRERSLIKFRNGSHQLLVATDLAARGLDIPDLKYIVHFQLPKREEEFIHRNGRTARMEKEGTAYVILNDVNHSVEFLPKQKPLTIIEDKSRTKSEWTTGLLSGGRKDKISKGDIVGHLMKKGGLLKDDIGLIEIKRDCAFIGIRKSKINTAIEFLNNQKLKKKKVRLREI